MLGIWKIFYIYDFQKYTLIGSNSLYTRPQALIFNK